MNRQESEKKVALKLVAGVFFSTEKWVPTGQKALTLQREKSTIRRTRIRLFHSAVGIRGYFRPGCRFASHDLSD